MNTPLELWGGLECTINRVKDAYFCQMERNGHGTRQGDLERFASLGIRAIRYPVLWERTAPNGLESADWSWADERLPGLQALGITPIVGLVHHGSGPQHTSLVNSCFAEKLAEFAGAVAARYPWVEYYTPVNEPLTTARFSGLYGVWYPHARSDFTFVQALLNQCRAVVLSMKAIRQVNPQAKLVQTDDISKTYSTPGMSRHAEFYNHRRWLSWDLLCGKVDREHAMWKYLVKSGVKEAEILWFLDNPCPPDIIGVNYYITSERWLDERISHYPKHYIGRSKSKRFADIETARVLKTPGPGIRPLLQETWERYGLPIAITEAHMGAHREDQLRWLLEIWEGAQQAKEMGADIRAVTVWALLGSFDWNCLVTACKGYYEPGPFDVRSPQPRPTAIAALMRELAQGCKPSMPALHGNGWWRRPERWVCPPVSTRSVATSVQIERLLEKNARPIMIMGSHTGLANAFARICKQRNLAYSLLSRQDVDAADHASVNAAVDKHQPWAIVNTSNYEYADLIEHDAERCHRENTLTPHTLASVSAEHGIHLMTFSSAEVFDGKQSKPYVESDSTAPVTRYGASQVAGERIALTSKAQSLIIRTGELFSPWDSKDSIGMAFDSLSEGLLFKSADDITISPTYVPDLVHTCLDLLIDRETGIWHIAHPEAMTWADLISKACDTAGISTGKLEARPSNELGFISPRSNFRALGSERGTLLPSIEDALGRYILEREPLLDKRHLERLGVNS